MKFKDIAYVVLIIIALILHLTPADFKTFEHP